MGGRKQNEKRIPTINECSTINREKQSVAAEMYGSLLIGLSSFPYFALIAFDVGGFPRLLLLLAVAPMAALVHRLVSEPAAIRVLIFATFAGVKVSRIKSAASTVLPKHYSEDLHPDTWRVFSSCGRKCVVTESPRIMVEPFLKNYLDVNVVLGTEISSFKGFATGLVGPGGVLVGETKARALEKSYGRPDVGIANGKMNLPFLRVCKEKYVVGRKPGIRPVRPETLPKPVIFHDGRLVQKPSPILALGIILWFPIGVILSMVRVLTGYLVPIWACRDVMRLLGVSIVPRGALPNHASNGQPRGVIYVCSHRTVIDAVAVSACLGHMTTSVSYSVAGFTEFLSPIKNQRLSRDRAKDAKLMEQILSDGKCLILCPEGTTCREPYLLRFSSLFAELTDQIVPVAVDVRLTLFHATTARGHKWLDPFFFLMNPFPAYQITFLDMLPPDQTCKAGKSSHQVANSVQKLIGEGLGYKCTNLTRKDKYRALAGNDGLVVGDEKSGPTPTSTLYY